MLTIGASHRTASPAVLGEFGRAAEAFRTELDGGVHAPTGVPVRELAVLATCARVEVYAVTDDAAIDEAERVLGRAVFGFADGVVTPTYSLRGDAALRHVCKVAAGLDSFVVGEHEIAGQVQRALRDAVRAPVEAGVLDSVAALVKHASRRVRTETGIGRHPASVSSVAVDIVRTRLGALNTRKALVVGAGEAGLLVAETLRRSGIGSLKVANRSRDRAAGVAARVDGEAAGLDALPDLLAEADAVVTATGAGGIVVDAASVREAVARRDPARDPLLMIDLARPGDIDLEVSALVGVELLTLEDVRARVVQHIALRRDEIGAAELVVDEVVDDFVRKQDAPDVDGFIGALRRNIEEVRSSEVSRFLGRREPSAPVSRDELDELTRSIVNKLLHDPMRRLRTAPSQSAAGRRLLGAVRELAGLDSTQGDGRGGFRG
jgi:glutamyl-tRNA reductase